MLFDLPDGDTLYAALLARDTRFDRRVWVCVTSTGIFCRLTCPARKPLRENCSFRPTVAECLAEGYRPFKRCQPLSSAATADPTVRDFIELLNADLGRRWSEADVARMGYDPSTVRRAFLRQFGMTFLEPARTRRLMLGFTALSEDERVIDAQLEAGFSSPAAFRAAFARLLGCLPRGAPARRPASRQLDRDAARGHGCVREGRAAPRRGRRAAHGPDANDAMGIAADRILALRRADDAGWRDERRKAANERDRTAP